MKKVIEKSFEVANKKFEKISKPAFELRKKQEETKEKYEKRREMDPDLPPLDQAAFEKEFLDAFHGVNLLKPKVLEYDEILSFDKEKEFSEQLFYVFLTHCNRICLLLKLVNKSSLIREQERIKKQAKAERSS